LVNEMPAEPQNINRLQSSRIWAESGYMSDNAGSAWMTQSRLGGCFAQRCNPLRHRAKPSATALAGTGAISGSRARCTELFSMAARAFHQIS
jgi:hypothetical protein